MTLNDEKAVFYLEKFLNINILGRGEKLSTVLTVANQDFYVISL